MLGPFWASQRVQTRYPSLINMHHMVPLVDTPEKWNIQPKGDEDEVRLSFHVCIIG